jgi:NUMOD3 motif
VSRSRKSTRSNSGRSHLTSGGDGGFIRSEETKQKMSIASKGKPKSEEHKRNMSKSHKYRKHNKHSEESKRKMSVSKKGKKLSEYHKKRISENHWTKKI